MGGSKVGVIGDRNEYDCGYLVLTRYTTSTETSNVGVYESGKFLRHNNDFVF